MVAGSPRTSPSQRPTRCSRYPPCGRPDKPVLFTLAMSSGDPNRRREHPRHHTTRAGGRRKDVAARQPQLITHCAQAVQMRAEGHDGTRRTNRHQYPRPHPNEATHAPASRSPAATPRASTTRSVSTEVASRTATGPGSKAARSWSPSRTARPTNVRPDTRSLNSCSPPRRRPARNATAATVPCPHAGSFPSAVKNRRSTGSSPTTGPTNTGMRRAHPDRHPAALGVAET